MKLSQIVIDKGTQTRESIDQKTVTEYAEVLMNKEVMPPLEVFSDGIHYYLVDGFHRYFAAKRANIPNLKCNIQEGTQRDAQLASFNANSKISRSKVTVSVTPATHIEADQYRSLDQVPIKRTSKPSVELEPPALQGQRA